METRTPGASWTGEGSCTEIEACAGRGARIRQVVRATVIHAGGLCVRRFSSFIFQLHPVLSFVLNQTEVS